MRKATHYIDIRLVLDSSDLLSDENLPGVMKLLNTKANSNLLEGYIRLFYLNFKEFIEKTYEDMDIDSIYFNPIESPTDKGLVSNISDTTIEPELSESNQKKLEDKAQELLNYISNVGGELHHVILKNEEGKEALISTFSIPESMIEIDSTLNEICQMQYIDSSNNMKYIDGGI